MSRKKFDKEAIEDVHGPMNSVAKEDAKVWASKHGVDYDEKQIKRIEIAKKKKAKRSTLKQDRRDAQQLMKYYGDKADDK